MCYLSLVQVTLENTKPVMGQFEILEPSGVSYGFKGIITCSCEIHLPSEHINM
jgi:hypothetical protein